MGKQKTAGSYARYLRIPELLRQQKTLSEAHDELQFIIVHQSFELWFKLLVFELESVRTAMSGNQIPQALHLLGRVHEIVKLLTVSFDVIETMRPYDFLEFRSLLKPASGFQSVQFREIECISGLRDPRYAELLGGTDAKRLRRRLDEPSVWDSYVELLKRYGLPARRDSELVRSVSQILQKPSQHPLGELTEALIQYDELFSLWRGRHIRMTMRMIGSRVGTGERSVSKLVKTGYEQMGSGGVDYLKTTLSKVFFPLLWEARTFVER